MTTRNRSHRPKSSRFLAARIGVAGLLTLSIAVAPRPADADESETQPVRATADFVMSPGAHVAVDALIGVFRNAQKVDERVARLAAEIERTQSVVAQARADVDAGNAEGARESLRQHSTRIRAIEAEFARSDGNERPNGSVEALRPRLAALLDGMAGVAKARGRAATAAELSALEGRLDTDLRVGDRGDSMPRPTMRQLGNPALRVLSQRTATGATDPAR